jgi:SOS regulatory protein LexA
MLTKRQKQVLDFLKSFKKRKGYAPSLEEIRKHLRLASVSTVHHHIKALDGLGYLKKEENQPRAIDIYESEQMIKIPLLGTIAAGQPIEPIQEKEGIAVPKSKLPKSGDFYALKVRGNSMIDENINDGDIVIIKNQPSAENGQKVVALIDNYEATLKKFYKERGLIKLQPANKTIEPIIIKKDREIVIQGIVIDVIKNEEELQAEKILTTEEIKRSIKKEKEILKKDKIERHLNKVYLGNIMNLLKKLPDKCVDMIFGDPDYNVGLKYGDKTYTKNFDEYINWYIELTKESMRVLKDDGNLFMFNYPKQNAHLRVKYLDNVYPLVNEYVWVYNTNVGHTPKRFTTAHRTILHIRKTENNKFYKDNVAVPYKNPTDRRILHNLKNGSKGRMPYDWFYFDLVKNVSKEKTYHACQIPQKLTEMLINSCTKPNDIVLVLFGGSGSELEVCKSLKRQYISAEIDPKYHDLILSRLKNGKIEERYKLQLKKNKKEKELPSLPLFREVSKEV